MNAREMFEKLNYRFKDDRLYIEYEYNDEYFFRFSKLDKQITIGNYHISLDELKAINQQCKELEWLDE